MPPQNRNNNLIPLPKPKPLARRPARTPVRPPDWQNTPIDPDDFEIPRRTPAPQKQGRHKPPPPPPKRTGKRQQAEPTWGEAIGVFTRRVARKTKKAFNNQPSPPIYHNPRNKRGRHRSKKKVNYAARIAAASAVCVVIIAVTTAIIWSFTNKNAYAVYLNDELIGHIARAKDIDETALQTQAVSKLESALAARVQVDERLTIKLVHSAGKDIRPDADVIDEVSRAFSYKIAGAAIYVEGREIAVLRTAELAEEVARQLQAPYVNGSFEDYFEVAFVEDWKVVTKLVSQEELNTPEDALLQLDKSTRAMENYIIESGDILGTIAQRFNTTVDKICADNPGYTASTILRVGDIIKMETTKPLLSVRTVEEIVRRESIPMPINTRQNYTEPKTYSKIISEGSDGEREVTLRITRVNGTQVGQPEEVGAHVTIEPVEKIVEVGTLDTPPDRR